MDFSFGIPLTSEFEALSGVMAILGSYVGLGLAIQARAATGSHRRGLLAGAAWSLGLGIWTMHFVGLLATKLPEGASFSILLTLLSFLLCVLVIGIAAFFVSREKSTNQSTAVASLLMGTGIVSMHYLGMHAITGPFGLQHDSRYIIASAVIAVAASHCALRVFESKIRRQTLAISALIFGLGVSGMHYTAMMGMTIVESPLRPIVFGPTVSGDVLTIVVTLLSFIVSGVFLLYLVPENSRNFVPIAPAEITSQPVAVVPSRHKVILVPIESEGATRLIPASEIYSVRATAHYTLVNDGRREHFSPWSITEAEERLAQADFMRVHRSHLVAIDRVKSLRKSGDGAIVEVGSPESRSVPVSKKYYAELKSRLGLKMKTRQHQFN